MIGIFKTKSPANILLLLVFGVLIKLPLFLQPLQPVAQKEDGLFFQWLLAVLQKPGTANPVIYSFLSFTLLFIQAIAITRFINSQRMMSKATYFPGMAYLLITSLFSEWNYLSPPLIVNTILLIVLSELFKSYNQQVAKGTIFNIGLALGISTFIFFPSVTFFIWIIFSLAIMRPFRLNEWILCLLGLTTPFYFYAVFLIINNEWSWHRIWPHFSVSLPFLKQSLWLAGSAFLLVVPFLLGSYHVQDSLRKMLIQVRKGWSLLLLFLIGSLFIPFVNSSDSLENWVIVAIPFAAFHAKAYLATSLRIIPVLLFWLTIAFIIGLSVCRSWLVNSVKKELCFFYLCHFSIEIIQYEIWCSCFSGI